MNPQLLKAVSNGDADLLAQILSTTTIAEDSRCACLEGVTADGSSALHIAARHGYLKLVEMICDQDISLIKATNNLLDTPLICAARAGHADVVDYLIQLASTQRDTEYVLRARNSGGATAVHEAVRNGHASVLGKIMSRDASLAAMVDGQGVSPLYMAVVSNRADMVDILIRESREGSVKSPASYAGPDGQTALHAAVFATNGMITRILSYTSFTTYCISFMFIIYTLFLSLIFCANIIYKNSSRYDIGVVFYCRNRKCICRLSVW
jgi:ankyrin repeat protein